MKIALEEFVGELRRELYRSMLAAQDQPLRLDLTGVEIEVQLVAERTDRADGGLKFWVVNLGGESAATAGSTQAVRLSLTPRLIDSQGPSPVTPYIDDEALPGER